MSRVLYIGGFANGQATAHKVGEALENHFELVDVMTFSHAMRSPGELRWASEKAHVITHSAGRLALQESGAKPEFVHAFNAPLPTPRSALLLRTAKKTISMAFSARSAQDATDILRYTTDSITEMFWHPQSNLQPFINGALSDFDGHYAARLNVAAGIPENFVVTDKDIYFSCDEEIRARMERNGVPVIDLPGVHDELPLRPERTLDLYFRTQAR